MKTRDLLIVVLIVVLLVFTFRATAPAPRPDRPVLGFVGRVLRWVALWYAVGEEPHPNYEAQPAALVNAPPQRPIGSDGYPRLDHGSGL
jgi:hypothetical protein